MVDQFIAVMLVWASYLSGYSIPDKQPTVILVNHQYFIDNVCHGVEDQKHPCHYVGLYTYGDRTIHIDQGMNKKEFNEILIHELVHFLQHSHNKYTQDTCNNRLAREHEAYGVQQKYITDAQHEDRTVSPPDDEEICSVN